MVGIRVPGWLIICGRLISPHIPAFTQAPGKELDSGFQTAGFDDRDHLIRLPAVFALHRPNEVDL